MTTYDVSHLLAQAECYKILALLYKKPVSGIQDNKKLYDNLVKYTGLLNPKAQEVAKKFRKTARLLKADDLRDEYSRLFSEAGIALTFPCSSLYSKKSDVNSGLMHWLKDIYQKAEFSANQLSEPIDHISTELGFLDHLLQHSVMGFRDDNMSAISRFGELRCTFMAEHMVDWVPEFTRAVLYYSKSPYYLQLAILTRALIVNCPGS